MPVQALGGLNGLVAAAPTDGASDSRPEVGTESGAFLTTLQVALQGSGTAKAPADDDAPAPITDDDTSSNPADDAGSAGAPMMLLALLLTPPASTGAAPAGIDGATTPNASAAGDTTVAPVGRIMPTSTVTSVGGAADGGIGGPASGGTGDTTGTPGGSVTPAPLGGAAPTASTPNATATASGGAQPTAAAATNASPPPTTTAPSGVAGQAATVVGAQPAAGATAVPTAGRNPRPRTGAAAAPARQGTARAAAQPTQAAGARDTSTTPATGQAVQPAPSEPLAGKQAASSTAGAQAGLRLRAGDQVFVQTGTSGTDDIGPAAVPDASGPAPTVPGSASAAAGSPDAPQQSTGATEATPDAAAATDGAPDATPATPTPPVAGAVPSGSVTLAPELSDKLTAAVAGLSADDADRDGAAAETPGGTARGSAAAPGHPAEAAMSAPAASAQQGAGDGQSGSGTSDQRGSSQGSAQPGQAAALGVAPVRGDRPEDKRLDERATASPSAATAGVDPATAGASVLGAAHAAAATGAQAVDRAGEPASPLVNQLAHGVHLAAEQPGQAVRLVLQPEGLGGVSLRIGLTHAGVNVHIAVDNPATRDLVQSSWPQLSQALDQQGVSVDRVFVELAQSQLGNQGGAGQQPGYQPPAPRAAPLSMARGVTADAPAAETVEASANRVDYRV
jgi:flagellar hook-length control protein FliK